MNSMLAGSKLCGCPIVVSHEDGGGGILDASCTLGECLGEGLLHGQPLWMPCRAKSVQGFAR